MRLPLFDMFAAVPRTYDVLNRLVSLGRDQAWRRAAARACLEARPRRVLDLCSGTGDLAVELRRLGGAAVEVTAFDYSRPMLEIAVRKARGARAELRPVLGDAGAMPFPDGAFDCVGISFGFRNLTWRNPRAERHLAEVLRVLAPGGRFVVVETSQPRSPLARALFRAYLRGFVRPVGSLVSQNAPAYRYLAESIARFYDGSEVERLLLGAGFREVRRRGFAAGAVALHVAAR
ncbi:MAG: ubiquinone/menaquinone biosynthesis methyltransferase [Planctomycetota bacterium]